MTISSNVTATQRDVSTWIANYIARTLDIPSTDIDPGTDLENLGLNSALVVSMIGDLEDWLGVELSPAIVFEYRTIDAIASYLTSAAPTEAHAAVR